MSRTSMVLLVVLLALLPVAGWVWLTEPFDEPLESYGGEPVARATAPAADAPYFSPEARAEGRARVLAVELPTSLPMLGEPGVGPMGYPLQGPDRAALGALLRAERFDELGGFLTALQSAYEEDYRKELWAQHGLESFGAADLTEPLARWVERSPDSWQAHAASGFHHVQRGYEARGTASIANTLPAHLARMEEHLTLARQELDRALTLRPTLHAAVVESMRAAKSGHADEVRGLYARALQLCPLCETARVEHFAGLAPRWYGQPGEREALVREALTHRAENPRLGAFAGFMAEEQCADARRARRYDAALAACTRAIEEGGEYWSFLMERGAVRIQRDETRLALADLQRAHALRPTNGRLLKLLEWVLFTTGERDEALELYEYLARLDPDDAEVLERIDSRVHALLVAGREAREAGDEETAVALFDRAERFVPGDYKVLSTRYAGLPAETIEARCRARVEARPESFAEHRCLDYALARAGRFADVVAMWGGYLERHPEDAAAYHERAGALHHTGREPEALADLRRACELGLVAACQREAQQRGG